MKRRHVIVLVLQSIFILLLLIYSYYQKAVADAETLRAYAEENKALEMERKYRELLDECGH
jgi:hypothetical protein